ncbi:MAG: acetyl-CoA carboxylase biotin carboxylase subunit [Dehalococcoidia bacterium]|nr:acetyl-CoA carboxylase biotin carboxylase subunit [Dehalococcoidia bacterium]
MPRKKKIPIQPPFEKILIANRGEIACRVIRTCRRMGILTVAVYSEADAHALHVQQADESVLIGPSPASESYLKMDAVIQAAKKTGAQAIHPGYGFLSQNPTFVLACQEAGIAFVGPSTEAMVRMGDKVLARGLAAEAGLPLIPGTGADITDREALDAAIEMGFPIMVKAAAGGGGIGIRLVATPEELPEAMERARSMGQSAFGSSKVYLEKYLENPSHVEVQVLADHHGNAVHLFERDCSIQRRNQKLIEETPCAKIGKRQRQKMYDAALALVEHIGYTNAGTVEFLLDQEGKFYFMEMNTRLQVEHPVTEMVTGLDMVEHQIRIAAGEPLSFSQKDVVSRGHAIEMRLYPEDPLTLMPTYGKVESLELPEGPEIRIDTALFPGYEISPFYEAMMGKVIAWGKSRKRAIATLTSTLLAIKIQGATTNIPLILQVLESEEFKKAKHSTQFLAKFMEEQKALLSDEAERDTVAAVTVALASLLSGASEPRSSSWKAYGRAAQMEPRPGQGGRW